MSVRRLPEKVEQLLKDRIRSLAELEVLLLLHRDPSRHWTAEAVNEELRTSLHSAQRCLTHLRDVQLVSEHAGNPATYAFRPQNDDDAATVADLVGVFKERMTAVIDAIYAPKRDNLRDFAEAFRINPKGDDDDG